VKDFSVWQSFDDLWAFGSAEDHALAITAPKLREANRELTARLEAAEKLVAKWRHDKAHCYQKCAVALEAAISPTPAQPAAGEKR